MGHSILFNDSNTDLLRLLEVVVVMSVVGPVVDALVVVEETIVVQEILRELSRKWNLEK